MRMQVRDIVCKCFWRFATNRICIKNAQHISLGPVKRQEN